MIKSLIDQELMQEEPVEGSPIAKGKNINNIKNI
jgi:hypothetical protein